MTVEPSSALGNEQGTVDGRTLNMPRYVNVERLTRHVETSNRLANSEETPTTKPVLFACGW